MFGKIAVLFVVLAFAAPAWAQSDAKGKIRGIRDMVKQGSGTIPQIAAYLNDPEQSVRLEAVKAIVQLDTQRSLDPLVKATADNDPEIQIRATDGLVNFYLPNNSQSSGLTAPIKKVSTVIKSRFTDTNDQVIDAYVEVRPDVIQALGKLSRGGASMEARAGAARALGILRGRAAVPDLIQAIKSSDTEVNYEGLIALQKIGDKTAAPQILFRLRDPVERVQIAAIETIGLLDFRQGVNQLRDAMDRSKSAKVRRAALTAMAMMPDNTTRPVFLYHLDEKDEGVRVAALEGLARSRNPSDQAAFQKAFTEEKKPAGRLAGAFGLVNLGQREMTDFAPLRYLVNQLNSAGYRGVALGYLKEAARDPAVRQALYPALQQNCTKDEKIGLAQALAASGEQDSIAPLEALSKDTDPEAAKEALRALQSVRYRAH